MKPYIVRPLGWSRANVLDRANRHLAGFLIANHVDWEVRCERCSWGRHRRLRADVAEALWRHYLDEHKEQAK